ncbi:MAG: hypothetical protein CMJ90_00945 [Planctomycetes bacterium]|nr:hypothetical protein [Planctomycetota bacterium]
MRKNPQSEEGFGAHEARGVAEHHAVMRILKVIHVWPPEGRGGTEAHAAQAAQALSARGHQVGVFARTGRPDRPEYEVTTEWLGNIGVTRVNNTYQDSWSFPWTYKNERVHEAFLGELGEFKPGLVHIHHLTGLSTTIVEAIKSRGIPCVMTLHDFWTVCPRGQRMMTDLHLCDDIVRDRCFDCLGGMWPHMFHSRGEHPTIVDERGELSPQILAEYDRHMAYALNLVDLLVTPSAFHRERMLEARIDPDRIVSLPHGMDHAPFAARHRGPDPVKRIAFIGSVTPVKGVHVLIEAFRAMGRSDIDLDIFGAMESFHEDTTYGDRIRGMAEGAGNIHFHGEYAPADVPGMLENVDVLVVPSLWWETFCLTIREGLLAGLPVVASDLGAMREALDGEQDGVFFRTGDPGDLREKLERLIDDDQYRQRFLNRGTSVKSLTDYAEELEDVYARAVRLARKRAKGLVVAPSYFPTDAPLAKAVAPPEEQPAPPARPTGARGRRASPSGQVSPEDREVGEQSAGAGGAPVVRKRDLPRARPGARHEVGGAPGKSRTIVSEGVLPIDRWDVQGPVKTRKVTVTEDS